LIRVKKDVSDYSLASRRVAVWAVKRTYLRIQMWVNQRTIWTLWYHLKQYVIDPLNLS